MNRLAGLLLPLALLFFAGVRFAQAQPGSPDQPATATIGISSGGAAQGAPQATAVTIAIFPFKNLSGEVKYDSLSWAYADSLVSYLNLQSGANTVYHLIPMGDVRDQMLAQNVDVKSPSYETDIWKLAQLLGATKLVWGTYFVKYDKANLEAKVIDLKTAMPDNTHFAEKIRPYYNDALTSVPTLAGRILPAMK